MHALNTITARNGAAAGREAAHALNDGDWSRYHRINDQGYARPEADARVLKAYCAGFATGDQEG